MFYCYCASIISLLSSSLVVISARNPIYSVLALIFSVINIIILLLILKAEFLALTFIAVYLGAVTVLFLFIVMMLNLKGAVFGKESMIGFLVGSFLGRVLFLSYLKKNNLKLNVPHLDFIDWKSIMDSTTDINVFGSVLYTHYAPFLLIIGVILLVAMIGVIVLTKINYMKFNKKRNFIDQQVSRNFKNAVFFVNEKTFN
jgi:NADH-quinone oxidoreductase subunit J